MRINTLLWILWAAMIAAMLLKWKADTYMVVATIILPILIVLLDLQEELNTLKEEAKHQRKFVMDRYTLLQEKLNDLSANLEKKLVVDFSEFARSNQPQQIADRKVKKKKKRRDRTDVPAVDLTTTPTEGPIVMPEDDSEPGNTPKV